MERKNSRNQYVIMAMVPAIAVTLLNLGQAYAAAAPDNSIAESAGSIVCTDPSSGNIKSELLDLWEVREVLRQTIVYDQTSSVEAQAEAAIGRLESLDIPFGRWVLTALKKLNVNTKDLGPSVKVDAPASAKNHDAMANCTLTGMSYVDDRTGTLYVAPTVFNAQQSATGTAASLVHEAVFKAIRENFGMACQTHGEEFFDGIDGFCPIHDSRIARTITGCLFTQDPATCIGFKKGELGIHPALKRVKDDENNVHTTKSIICSNSDGSTQVSANVDIHRHHDFSYDDSLMFFNIKHDNGWNTDYDIQNYFVERLNGTKILAGPSDTQTLRALFADSKASQDSDNYFLGITTSYGFQAGTPLAFDQDVQTEYDAGEKLKLTLDQSQNAVTLSCKAK